MGERVIRRYLLGSVAILASAGIAVLWVSVGFGTRKVGGPFEKRRLRDGRSFAISSELPTIGKLHRA